MKNIRKKFYGGHMTTKSNNSEHIYSGCLFGNYEPWPSDEPLMDKCNRGLTVSFFYSTSIFRLKKKRQENIIWGPATPGL